jgi:peptidyl-prolyl cis-trans isomerase B (cyclophilin B)
MPMRPSPALPLLVAALGVCGPTLFGAATQTQTAPAAAEEEVGVITTDVGQIVLRFFPDTAPGHVENFKALARSRFYDGTTFHRVVPGFVIQGGDPNSKDENPANDGLGDGPRRLKAEFSNLPHKRGALSMARSQHPDSASCQFFIVLEENARTRALDGKYTIFGEVVEGLDTVDRIVAASQPIDMGAQRPARPVIMRKVRIERRPLRP